MSLAALLALMITLTAVLSWLNERFLRLPQTIGVMLAALCLSLALLAAGGLGWLDADWGRRLLSQVDFNAVLMRGMLSFLLFAGALHVDISGLLQHKWTILVLSTVGVLSSTFLIGSAFYWICAWAGIAMPYLVALVFGALISPTDPIAVLGILKQARVPERLELNIVGESLFNDGVGVVVFTILVDLTAVGHGTPSIPAITKLFLVEAVGGALFGLLIGYLAYRMLRSVDHYTVEILITLSLVAGGYTLAGALHTSGPIAMVVAGLFIGNHGRLFGMSDRTRVRLDEFWEVVDETLNALLFVMIGLEILILEPRPGFLLVAVIAVPVVLVSRLVSIGTPLVVLRLMPKFDPRRLAVLTWAGLRGGISVALALSLPASSERDLILVVSYAVVIFSIVVQGLTVGRVVRWAGLAEG